MNNPNPIYAVISGDNDGPEVEIWSDIGLAVASAKKEVGGDGTIEVVVFNPPREGTSKWIAGDVVFASTDGEIDVGPPPSIPGLRPFRVVDDDALLTVGRLIVWSGPDGKLYPAHIVALPAQWRAGLITVKEDKPDCSSSKIWIENIKFIRA